MYKTNDIFELIKKKEIDPFEILNITKSSLLSNDIKFLNKNYKKKALILHPDKTNGETELEFKILSVCYKYLLKIKEKYNSKYTEYSQSIFNQQYSEKNIINNNLDTDSYIKSIYDSDTNLNMDWGSKNIRQKYMIDDDQEDESDFLERSSKKKQYFSYGSALRDNKIDNFLLKKNEKFNIDKFNAIFNKYKEINEKGQQLVKREIKDLELLDSNNSSVQMHEIYKVPNVGVIIHDPAKTKKIHGVNVNLYKNEPENIITKDILKNIKREDIKKEKINRTSKNAMKNSEIKQKINEYHTNIKNIDPNDIETEEQMEEKIINKYIQHETQGTEFLEKHLHIFPKQIQQSILQQIKNSEIKLLK